MLVLHHVKHITEAPALKQCWSNVLGKWINVVKESVQPNHGSSMLLTKEAMLIIYGTIAG